MKVTKKKPNKAWRVLLVTCFTSLTSSAPSEAITTPSIITLEGSAGDCKGQVNLGISPSVASEGSSQVVSLYLDPLSSMNLSTDIRKMFQSKRCTLQWRITLPSSYRFAKLQTWMQGHYTLSPQGIIRLTTSHGVANQSPLRMSKFLGKMPSGHTEGSLGFDDLSLLMTNQDLPEELKKCGAEIPLTSSLFVSITQPTSDNSGLTSITWQKRDPGDSTIVDAPKNCSEDTKCWGTLTITPCFEGTP